MNSLVVNMKGVIFCIAALLAAASAANFKPEYHWKDFYGHVPEEAVKVVGNNSDVVGYIGQGYFPGIGLLPGMITDGMMELKAVANGQIYTIQKNIKVLSTYDFYPEKYFHWISINYANLEALGNLGFLKLVPGGTESDSMVYIGRHSEPGYTNVGKIYTKEPYQGLTIPDRNGKVTIYKNFQVLVMLTVDCGGVVPLAQHPRDSYSEEDTLYTLRKH